MTEQPAGTLSAGNLGTILGCASMALEFCRQPETYPVFSAWLDGCDGGGWQPVSPGMLEAADMVLTEWAGRMFEAARRDG